MVDLIKGVFSDIWVLYKNFLHFVLSKILIYAVTFLITLLFLIPFLIVGFIFKDFFLSVSIFSIDYFWIFVLLIFVFLAVFFLLLGYSYSQILLTKLSLTYKSNKKLEYKKNYYFSAKMFYNYTKVFLLNFLILLSPILFVLLGFFVVAQISGGQAFYIEESALNGYSISLLVLTIFGFLVFLYLLYKTSFSYIALVDESKGTKFKKASYYISRSFSLTKGFNNFSRLLVILALVFTVTLPIVGPKDYFDSESKRISDYRAFLSGDRVMTQTNIYYFEDLKLNYGDLEETNLSKSKKTYASLSWLFWLLDFLLLYGLFNMVMVSFYKRQLLKK